MRKVILFNFISLDGFFSGPDGEIEWHQVNEEHNLYALEQIRGSDLLVFGRLTYELMASYWPSADAGTNDPEIAEAINAIPKLVFSKTLTEAGWNNTRLSRVDAAIEIAKLKNEDGKNICILGSADLASSLVPVGLVDEFQIIVNPIILGSGRALFQNIRTPIKLHLVRRSEFRNGNVLLVYHTAQ
jgi:dihydrofolate reductase